MSRAFWFAVGAGTSFYASVRTRRAVERFTPAGIGDQVGALAFGARLLHEEVMVGMAERETELREDLAVLEPGRSPYLSVTPGRERGSN